MSLKGIKVGNTAYSFDYDYLDNKPSSAVLLPAVTSEDEGKFLRVTSAGAWAAEEIAAAEEATF